MLLLSAEAFLDINLNDGLSGIELRHRLKAAGISVPVIYMTGNDNPAVRVAALQSGCVAYLTNPFSAKSLIEPLESTAQNADPLGKRDRFRRISAVGLDRACGVLAICLLV